MLIVDCRWRAQKFLVTVRTWWFLIRVRGKNVSEHCLVAMNPQGIEREPPRASRCPQESRRHTNSGFMSAIWLYRSCGPAVFESSGERDDADDADDADDDILWSSSRYYGGYFTYSYTDINFPEPLLLRAPRSISFVAVTMRPFYFFVYILEWWNRREGFMEIVSSLAVVSASTRTRVVS